MRRGAAARRVAGMLGHGVIRAAGRASYSMSFMTLGICWVGQQTRLNHVARSNRDLAGIHLGFLLAVALMPFSTGLLAEFITYRLALVAWLNHVIAPRIGSLGRP